MEKNKYYTPDISEFHVGFEYEGITNRDGKTYLESIICIPSTFKDLRIDDGTLCGIECKGEVLGTRVKYLDKSDIESLGFKILKESSLNDERHTCITYDIVHSWPHLVEGYKLVLEHQFSETYDKNDNKLDTYASSIKIIVRKIEENTIEDIKERWRYFMGEIKNKSELKVLLKQLGIE